MTIPVITLWQPWATLIALGWKRIETRTHNRFRNLEGQTIGIHAGNKWDSGWSFLAGNFLTNEQYTLIMKMQAEKEMPFGKIICTGKVYTYRKLVSSDSEKALIECDTERYGLFIYDIKKIEPPIEAKGKQGIWYFDLSRKTKITK